jgi:hypothetical protein
MGSDRLLPDADVLDTHICAHHDCLRDAEGNHGNEADEHGPDGDSAGELQIAEDLDGAKASGDDDEEEEEEEEGIAAGTSSDGEHVSQQEGPGDQEEDVRGEIGRDDEAEGLEDEGVALDDTGGGVDDEEDEEGMLEAAIQREHLAQEHNDGAHPCNAVMDVGGQASL